MLVGWDIPQFYFSILKIRIHLMVGILDLKGLMYVQSLYCWLYVFTIKNPTDEFFQQTDNASVQECKEYRKILECLQKGCTFVILKSNIE